MLIWKSVTKICNGDHGNCAISRLAPTCGDVIKQFYDPEMMPKLLVYDDKCYFLVRG